MEDRIRKLAHQYWEERGMPLGTPEIDWLRAERDVMESAQGEEDTGPDEPPRAAVTAA